MTRMIINKTDRDKFILVNFTKSNNLLASYNYLANHLLQQVLVGNYQPVSIL